MDMQKRRPSRIQDGMTGAAALYGNAESGGRAGQLQWPRPPDVRSCAESESDTVCDYETTAFIAPAGGQPAARTPLRVCQLARSSAPNSPVTVRSMFRSARVAPRTAAS